METNTTRLLLDRFSDAIEAEGIEAVPADLMISFVEVARSVAGSPVAIGVLADPTEPSVVRERAFCKLAIQVVGRTSSRRTVAPIAVSTLRPLLPA
jgi:hypothetical protein